MIIHGDLPLVTNANLTELIASHSAAQQMANGSAITIATDEHAQGSNCLIIKSGLEFVFAYGEKSLQRHESEAKKRHLTFQQCQIHGIACDIDYPDDLLNVIKNTDELCARKTKEYLVISGIDKRFETSTLNQIRNSQGSVLNEQEQALGQVG
jgi:2-phospho-L-lactate guanylyltransferase (CobY/MobA/RfbA family)